MSLKNLTVDDILSEIKLKDPNKTAGPTSDMGQVDKLVFDILARRQEELLGKERKDMSLREKKQLDDEIKFQTKNLTMELEAIKKHRPDFKITYEEKEEELKRESTAEIKISQIARAQKVKYRDTSELDIPQKVKDKKEQKLKELQKSANDHLIIKDMKNITDHFGRFKTDDEGVNSGNVSTDITRENYKEYKDSRNKKVDAFIIDHRKPESERTNQQNMQNNSDFDLPNNQREKEIPNGSDNQLEASDRELIKRVRIAQTDSVNLKTIRETMAEKRQDKNFNEEIVQEAEYEYFDKSQNTEVFNNLLKTKKGIKLSFAALAILLIPAIMLLFLGINTGEAGGFAVSASLYALINMGILLLAIVFSGTIFSNAIQSMGERKPDRDILYSLMLIVSLLANVAICLKPLKLTSHGVILYTPIIVFILLVNFFVKLVSINKIIKNFSFISNDNSKCGLIQVSDIQLAFDMTKGTLDVEPNLVKNVKINFFKNFLSSSFSPDLSDEVSTKMAIYALPVMILIGGIGLLLTKDIHVGITIASGIVLMLTSFLGAIFVVFPIRDTAGVVSHFSGMMPEYSAIDAYKDTNAVMIKANELFPTSSISLHGIKTFQGGRIDDAIIDAASVVCAADSVLRGVFLSIINDNESLLRPVDSIIYEDLMGVSAWVDGKRVLIGNRELMINHSIAVPKQEYEEKYRAEGNEVVFLSNGGELCAAFIIAFSPDRMGSDIVNLLAKNDIVAVVKTVDACVTAELFAKVYETDETLFKILPSRLHKGFEEEHEPIDKADSLLGNNGSAFGYIVEIVACKKLSYCTKLGSFMYILSSILGSLLLFAMTILKTFGAMGNLQMLIFMSAFAVAYWIYEKNMKL